MWSSGKPFTAMTLPKGKGIESYHQDTWRGQANAVELDLQDLTDP